ncbi:hypothetical protein AAFF_G00409910 [Aldrovandia affinis]|uniref:Uncharacterized protein n=1 Tax=Aldrovandia affinis TaxID=143900 RepID=A0AAD7SBN9_9TELE|nr:hypothetical protein AAFF_G00409910 [Aldrovandia affinis]
MPEQEDVEEEREMEAQELTDDDALLHFSRYSEARAAIPWEQRTFREKVVYHIDRIFLAFLLLFLLVLLGETIYKIWYMTNFQKLQKFVVDTLSLLLKQEKEEELIEL